MTELPHYPSEPAETADPAAAPVQHGMPRGRQDASGLATFAAEPGDAGIARVTAWVRGHVQGVGFRWWTRSRALELGLVGWARNLEDGRVEVLAQGPRAACEALLDALRGGRTPGRVTGVTERWSDPRNGLTGFVER